MSYLDEIGEIGEMVRARQRALHAERSAERGRTAAEAQYIANIVSPLFRAGPTASQSAPYSVSTTDPTKEFEQLKKSIKKIRSEPLDKQPRKNIESKISRLQRAGLVSQAKVLEGELTTRDSLNRLKEWDYKVLSFEKVEYFRKQQGRIMATSFNDALKLHIDTLEEYIGNPEKTEAKDRIVPTDVLEKLEAAKERQLFDELSVLWAEKVKDPLLLGRVDGCKDYFLIAEWGDDITFDQIMKGK